MSLTATQQAWVLNPEARRVLSVEFPSTDDLNASYIASEGWATSGASGHLHFEGRIVRPWTLSREIGGRVVGGGRTSINLGDITVTNADGLLTWMEEDWSGRDLIIRWGDPDWSVDDHIIIHRGTVDTLSGNDIEIVISITDARNALEQVYPRTRWTSADGKGDGEGQLKGMIQGYCRNIPTVWLDDAQLIIGVFDGDLECTNLFTRSQEFTHADWQDVGTVDSVTDNFAEAPDGTQTAARLVTTGIGGLDQPEAGATGHRVISIWVKSNTSLDQTVTLSIGGNSSEFTAVTDAWRRVVHDHDDASVGTARQILGKDVDILIWGAQLEPSEVLHDYLRTEGTSLTYPLIEKVRDNGVELTEGDDINDTGTDWEYLGDGKIQLDNYVGKITADVTGPTGLDIDASDILFKILSEVGGNPTDVFVSTMGVQTGGDLQDSSSINWPGINTMTEDLREVGLFSDRQRKVVDYLDGVCDSVGAAWFFERSGDVSTARFDIPGAPVFVFSEKTIQGGATSELATDPIGSIILGVRNSWSDQGEDALDPAIPGATKQGYGQRLRYRAASSVESAGALSGSETSDKELAQEGPTDFEPIETLLTDFDQAIAEGRRWQTLMSVGRRYYESSSLQGAGIIELGDTVRVQHVDIFEIEPLLDEDGEPILDESYEPIEQGVDVIALSIDETFPYGSVNVRGWA